jgi:flagellar protein FlaF
MSLAAYKRVAQVTETTRQIEARLLGDVCRELSLCNEEGADRTRRLEALDWNRRVWMTLTLDCGSPDNPLPPELRARIVSLGIWVHRYTEEVMWQEADMQPLLDVNGALIKGLTAAPAQAA